MLNSAIGCDCVMCLQHVQEVPYSLPVGSPSGMKSYALCLLYRFDHSFNVVFLLSLFNIYLEVESSNTIIRSVTSQLELIGSVITSL